jgi:hypothetical protein
LAPSSTESNPDGIGNTEDETNQHEKKREMDKPSMFQREYKVVGSALLQNHAINTSGRKSFRGGSSRCLI